MDSLYLDKRGLQRLWEKIKFHFAAKNHVHGMQQMCYSLYHFDGDTSIREVFGNTSETIPLTMPTDLPEGAFIKIIEIYFMDNDKNQGVARTIRQGGIDDTKTPWNEHVALFTGSMPSGQTVYVKCKHMKVVDTTEGFNLIVDQGYAYDGGNPAKWGEGYFRGKTDPNEPLGQDAYTGTYVDGQWYESNHIGILDVIGYI